MDNTLNRTYKCAKCQKNSSMQCSGCHKVVYCSIQCQQTDWPKHRITCLQEQNKQLLPQSTLQDDKKKPTLVQPLLLSSQTQSQTKPSLLPKKKPYEPKKIIIPIPPFPFLTELSRIFFFKSNKQKTDRMYSLALTHRKHFLEYLETNPFKFFIEYSASLYNKYKSCLHYMHNYILLIRLYMNEGNREMAQQTLITITKELFEEKLSEALTKIFTIFIKTTNKKNTSIKPQNIQIARQIFLSFLSCMSFLMKASKHLNCPKLYAKYLFKYIQIYYIALNSLNQSKEKQSSIMKSSIYFIYGCLYVREAQFSVALNFFNQVTLNEYKDTLLSTLIYSSFFNQGVIYYSMNKLKEAKEKALSALESKLSLLSKQAMDDDQLRLIYLLLTEIDIENQNYTQANRYIDLALDTIAIEASDEDKDFNTISRDDYRRESFSREQDNNTSDKTNRIDSKVIRLLRVLKDKSAKLQEKESSNNKEELYDKIMSYLNEEMRQKKIAIDNEYDISDMKNFFLFMTKLSLHQIDVLNKTQGLKVCVNLPILFSKEFKNTLNPAQRSHFDKLQKLTLIRSNVLKNINGKIELENLKYDLIQVSDNYSIAKLQDYSQMKKFLAEMHPKLNQSKEDKQLTKKITQLMNVNQTNKDRRVSFLYKNEYNISKMKIVLKIYLNSGKHQYTEETVNQMREFVGTPLFNLLLNQMSLENIKELEKEPGVLCELLSEYMKQLEKSSESGSEDIKLDEIERVDTQMNELIKSENEDNEHDSSASEEEIVNARKKAMTFSRKGIRRIEPPPRKKSFVLEEDENLYV